MQRKRRLATLKEGANLWQQLHRCAAALAPTARRKVANETCFSAGLESSDSVPVCHRSSTLRRATPLATESFVPVAAAPLGTLASVILNYELPDVQWQHGRSHRGSLHPFSPVYSARPAEIVTAHHTPMHAAVDLRADADLLPHRQHLLTGGCILDEQTKQIDQSTRMDCGITAEHLPYLDEIQDSARQLIDAVYTSLRREWGSCRPADEQSEVMKGTTQMVRALLKLREQTEDGLWKRVPGQFAAMMPSADLASSAAWKFVDQIFRHHFQSKVPVHASKRFLILCAEYLEKAGNACWS